MAFNACFREVPPFDEGPSFGLKVVVATALVLVEFCQVYGVVSHSFN